MRLVKKKNKNFPDGAFNSELSNLPSTDLDDGEMRLGFCSKGEIYLESGEATFKTTNCEGVSLIETNCFGQIVSIDFDRMFEETSHFKYSSSAVRFMVNFYNDKNQLLGKLISDSIFENVGFGRGEGKWSLNS